MINNIIHFVYAHLKEILMALYCVVMIIVAIISVIVLIFKKIKNQDNDLVYVLSSLPEWIKEAERIYSDGHEKYAYVFSAAIKLLSSLKKIDDSKVIQKYGFIIDDSIESILSTPTKKGGNDEKNNEKKER